MLITYCEPFNRSMINPVVDSHIQKDDIMAALDYFHRIGDVQMIYLNPYYLKTESKHYLNIVLPDEIEILSHPGCAGWEVMAEVSEKKDKKITRTEIPQENLTPEISNPVLKRQDIKDAPPATLRGSGGRSLTKNTVDFDYSMPSKVKPVSVSKISVSKIKKERKNRSGLRGRPLDPTATSRSTLYRRRKMFPEMKGEVLI